ncbi:unnamed protein product [Cladocopium goreaui]|uniref:Kinesin light chain 1 (KLC 1) n=1 Tax=Cladocopium goreaui TaxID=2562237 RepID=A0A9P1FIB7_9DINO|nr:unnamed protein product [Cladocopium goreaui]
MGQLKDAEALHRRALEAQERTLGGEHPSTLASVNTLAICLRDMGQLKDAEALYRRDLEAQERTLGAEHPSTLASVNGLALCLRDISQLKDAEALHRRDLEASERTLGAEHPFTLVAVEAADDTPRRAIRAMSQLMSVAKGDGNHGEGRHRFGDIGDVFVPRERYSDRPRPFAFVRFVEDEDATEVDGAHDHVPSRDVLPVQVEEEGGGGPGMIQEVDGMMLGDFRKAVMKPIQSK